MAKFVDEATIIEAGKAGMVVGLREKWVVLTVVTVGMAVPSIWRRTTLNTLITASSVNMAQNGELEGRNCTETKGEDLVLPVRLARR